MSYFTNLLAMLHARREEHAHGTFDRENARKVFALIERKRLLNFNSPAYVPSELASTVLYSKGYPKERFSISPLFALSKTATHDGKRT